MALGEGKDMRLVISIALILAAMATAQARSQSSNLIRVKFSIDGTSAPCRGFHVELRLNGASIKARQSGQGFEVPEEFLRAAHRWKDNQRVDISLTCSGHTLIFPGVHPGFVEAGEWELGIAQPLYAVKEYGYSHEFDRGTWLSYLIFEGEPGVVVLISQSAPPDGLSDSLQKEAPNASPERARDIAYVLAVLSVDYEKNRDQLLSSLNGCLSRPKESPEDDLCDSDLLRFVVNLYWRGDSTLLGPLLQIAESRHDVIGEIGDFYSDLLDRRGAIALIAMEDLPNDKGQTVCKLANDDLSYDPPKRERVIAYLEEARSEAAAPCLKGLSSNH